MTAGLVLATAAAAEVPVLTVYTYDSFTSEWGPGPAIEAGFEAGCGCDLRFVAAGDGAALLSRLLIEGPTGAADVVVGLDQNLIARAGKSGLFAPAPAAAGPFDLPVAWGDPVFVPYDWGYFAFVHDTTRTPVVPQSLAALAASDMKVLIQDPRASTPGLGLVLWVKAALGDGAAAFWRDMADNVVTVTPGWSEAYGLFLKGEADMVLSYTTSPAYHLIAEGDATKAAAPFAEGHYLQVEVAAKMAATDVPDLADAFLAYLVSDAAQGVIPTTNWMYPARTPDAGLPEGFETLIRPEKALMLPPDDAEAVREEALAEWLAGLGR
jgi:thiamine transport system substrate-binding protein